METITINQQTMTIKSYQGQRVVTFKDVDAVHDRPEGTARKRFNDNKDRFILGVDYFVRNPDEAKKELNIIAPNGLTLLTESGYLMLVKSFTDDLAWAVQRQLVNTYFRAVADVAVYPPKSTSASEIANLLKSVDKVMIAQKSPPYKRASQAEKILRQFGVDVIDNFVEPSYPQVTIMLTN